MGVMSTSTQSELVDLELAFDSFVHKHPEHAQAHRDLLSLWSVIGTWRGKINDKLGEVDVETLNWFIVSEEQARVVVNQDPFLLLVNLSDEAGGNFHEFDPLTEEGLDKLKALLTYIRQYGAALGVSIWAVEFGLRPKLTNKMNSLRNRVLVDIAPNLRKNGLILYPKEVPAKKKAGELYVVYKDPYSHVEWDGFSVRLQRISSKKNGLHFAQTDAELETIFRGSKYD